MTNHTAILVFAILLGALVAALSLFSGDDHRSAPRLPPQIMSLGESRG